MPTLTIVPQFVSQTATGGLATWNNPTNVNVYGDGVVGGSGAANCPISAAPDQNTQTLTLLVNAQPLLAGATIHGVRFSARSWRTSGGGGQRFQYNGPLGSIHDYFEAADTPSERVVGSLSTFAPNTNGLAWTAGFNLTVVGTMYHAGTTLYLDAVQFEVEYTPAPQSGLTPAALLLLDE